MAAPIRIANCSGFFGDRPSGAVEMVEGGPIDVLTGDWLAELTMLILARTRAKRPNGGFARTFVRQMEALGGTSIDEALRFDPPVTNSGRIASRDLEIRGVKIGEGESVMVVPSLARIAHRFAKGSPRRSPRRSSAISIF